MTDTQGQLPPLDESQPSLAYCGITFSRTAISGTTLDKLPVSVPRAEITSLAVRALVSRSRAMSQVVVSLVILAAAAAVGLKAMGVIHPFGDLFLRSLGLQAGVLIVLVGTGYRILSTAWDPRHVLAITTPAGSTTLDFQSRPEPIKLIATIEQIQQNFGYDIDLYPKETPSDDPTSV